MSDVVLRERIPQRPPAAAEISVRFASSRDVAQVAHLFVEAFALHPVSSLPAPLQRRFLAAQQAEGLMLVAIDVRSERIVGFAVGGNRAALERARRTFIRRNAIWLTACTFSSAAAIRRFTQRGRRTYAPSPATGCELRYLAVDPRERERGIGSALVRSLERMITAGQAYYVWALASRTVAMRFYAVHGFRVEVESNGHVRMIKNGR